MAYVSRPERREDHLAMTKSTKNFLYAVALLCGVVATSACNRGYGCPTDFSMGTEQPSALE